MKLKEITKGGPEIIKIIRRLNRPIMDAEDAAWADGAEAVYKAFFKDSANPYATNIKVNV